MKYDIHSNKCTYNNDSDYLSLSDLYYNEQRLYLLMITSPIVAANGNKKYGGGCLINGGLRIDLKGNSLWLTTDTYLG